jgi:hypothetical protein
LLKISFLDAGSSPARQRNFGLSSQIKKADYFCLFRDKPSIKLVTVCEYLEALRKEQHQGKL